MSESDLDLNQFILALFEAPYRWIKQATEELTQAQIFYQPAPDANSIGWLIWHLSRWRDRISALAAGAPEVWTSAGWDQRFNMESERTGLGDTLEQVAAFRVEISDLVGYAEAAHNVLMERVANLTPEQFQASIQYGPRGERPAWRALVSVVEDSAEHTGQINYLRGLITGHGWRPG